MPAIDLISDRPAPKRLAAGLAALIIGLFAVAFGAAQAREASLEPLVHVDRNIAVPARDGVRLNGVLYRPAQSHGRLPTILAMTPYMADSWHDKGMYFAAHGYNFLVVDHRGRGNSAGDYTPWLEDGHDGFDTVQWIAGQPWSDGKVGMMGGSYSGRNQWATAREFPPALKTIVPTASNFIGFDFPAHRGIWSAWGINWYAGVYGRTTDKAFRDDYDYFSASARSDYLAGRAFAGFGERLGMPSPVYQQWYSHPDLDAFWTALSPSADEFRRIDIPVLTITGQYDGVQLGAIEYYKRQLASHGEGASRHYLVIGPWNHGGTRNPKPDIGGLKVGPASLVDIDQLHLDWFDWTLKGGAKPAFLRDKLLYYVTGEEAWRDASSLAGIGAEPERLYLSGEGGHSSQAPGVLADRPGKAAPARFIYDPKDTSYGKDEPIYAADYLRDTYPADHLNGAGLIFDTAPFAAPRTLAGQPSLSLTLTVDVPDTDLEATLYEVDAGGRSLKLGQDQIRLRYRDSNEHPSPMPIGKPVQVRLPDFTFVARQIAAGSRLRLVVRPVNSIYAEKNYNSGGEVSRETLADARVAHIAIAEGGARPSFLDLPFLPVSGAPH